MILRTHKRPQLNTWDQTDNAGLLTRVDLVVEESKHDRELSQKLEPLHESSSFVKEDEKYTRHFEFQDKRSDLSCQSIN